MQKDFDFLPDNDIIINPDTEYIYRMDMVWVVNSYESYKVKKSMIVHKVVAKKNGGYVFTVKDTHEVFECNYGWAFAENTPDNIVKLKAFDEQNDKLTEISKVCDKLRKKVTTLDSNNEINYSDYEC